MSMSRCPVVVVEESADALPASNLARVCELHMFDPFSAQSLVGTFVVMVLKIHGDNPR